MSKEVNNLGEAMRIIRISSGFSAVELSRKMGVVPSHLSELEAGKKIPSIATLAKWGREVGVKRSDLFLAAEAISEDRVPKFKSPHFERNRYFRILEVLRGKI